MTERPQYWWRLSLYEHDEGTIKAANHPFRRIEFKVPASWKHASDSDVIDAKLAKVGYRVSRKMDRRAKLKDFGGDYDWMAGASTYLQRPGRERLDRTGDMERPFATGPGPDEPVKSARGIKVIDWPNGRPPKANPMRLEDFTGYCEDLAAAYDAAPEYDESEVWRWELLRDSVDRMYDQVTQKVDVEFVEGQPYETAEEMREEVQRTGIMYISTEGNEHPVFTEDENLRFRAVHDYIVHIIPGERGPDFSRRGELRAYNLHRRLAPRDAWPALFTEVAAQACYVNARGEFPVQKIAVLDGFDFYNVGWRDNVGQAAAANPSKLKRKLLFK